MRIFVWLVRAALFFTLFAFALNNQQVSSVRWFFGHEWRAPMVFIVLAAFVLGCAFGIFALLPSWWRHRREARAHAADPGFTSVMPEPARNVEPVPQHPPRDGL